MRAASRSKRSRTAFATAAAAAIRKITPRRACVATAIAKAPIPIARTTTVVEIRNRLASGRSTLEEFYIVRASPSCARPHTHSVCGNVTVGRHCPEMYAWVLLGALAGLTAFVGVAGRAVMAPRLAAMGQSERRRVETRRRRAAVLSCVILVTTSAGYLVGSELARLVLNGMFVGAAEMAVIVVAMWVADRRKAAQR
jgi:hypothetical protein